MTSATPFELALEEEAEVLGPARPYAPPLAANGGGQSPRGPARSHLPGQGEPRKGCGKWVPKLICQTDLLALLTAHRCLSPGCPECAGRCPGWAACPVGLPPHLGGEWAHSLAFDATDRFEDYIEQNGLGRIPLRQVIYTVPLDRYSEEEDHHSVKTRIRRAAESKVRKSEEGGFAWRGRYGGCAVVHLYSCPDVADGKDDPGNFTKWHPHVHLLCFGIDVRAWSRYLEDHHRARTGRSLKECLEAGPCRSHRDDPDLPRCRGTPPFLLRQVNSRTGGFASYRGFGLRRHLVYELGHASITDAEVRSGTALSWFGSLHTWRQPPPPKSDVPKCPKCEARMEPPPWRWEVVDPLDAGTDSFRFGLPSGGTVEYRVLREQAAGPPEDPEETAKWDALLNRIARERARARGDEEVETRDPSPYDRRAWGDPRSPSEAARDLRDELDRLEREEQ